MPCRACVLRTPYTVRSRYKTDRINWNKIPAALVGGLCPRLTPARNSGLTLNQLCSHLKLALHPPIHLTNYLLPILSGRNFIFSRYLIYPYTIPTSYTHPLPPSLTHLLNAPQSTSRSQARHLAFVVWHLHILVVFVSSEPP